MIKLAKDSNPDAILYCYRNIKSPQREDYLIQLAFLGHSEDSEKARKKLGWKAILINNPSLGYAPRNRVKLLQPEVNHGGICISKGALVRAVYFQTTKEKHCPRFDDFLKRHAKEQKDENYKWSNNRKKYVVRRPSMQDLSFLLSAQYCPDVMTLDLEFSQGHMFYGDVFPCISKITTKNKETTPAKRAKKNDRVQHRE